MKPADQRCKGFCACSQIDVCSAYRELICLYNLSKNLGFAELRLTTHGVSRYMGVAKKEKNWVHISEQEADHFWCVFSGVYPIEDQAARLYDKAPIFLVIFTIVHMMGSFVKVASSHSIDWMQLLYQVLYCSGS